MRGTNYRISLGGKEFGGAGTASVPLESGPTPAQSTPPQPPVAPRGLSVYASGRPGRLPHAGSPTIGGIELPPGRPAQGLPLWVSDKAIPNPLTLAARLANKFPRTGLWPLLWGAGDRPEGYMDGPAPLAGITHVDVKRVLALRWHTDS